MDEHHAERITQKPDAAQLSEIGFLDVFELLVSGDNLDDGWPAESHQGGGSGMKPWCARKQVNAQSQGETQHQELPFWCAEGQQHNENQVNVRVYITAQADVVDDQHLEKHEHNEADDLQHGLVHVIGI